MARIKIALPNVFLFETSMELRISDINYGGHLGNDTVLALAHEARMRYLKTMEMSEHNCFGCALIMTDAGVVYKSQGFFGDKIVVKVGIIDISGFGFDFVYQIVNSETSVEIARVKTGMAFFDYDKNKISKTPKEFENKYNIA